MHCIEPTQARPSPSIRVTTFAQLGIIFSGGGVHERGWSGGVSRGGVGREGARGGAEGECGARVERSVGAAPQGAGWASSIAVLRLF